jgi:dienelactone hydrolase
MSIRFLILSVFSAALPCVGAVFPGASPLGMDLSGAQRSQAMVAGIDRLALRLMKERAGSQSPDRARLREILGVVDERAPAQPQWLEGPGQGPLLERPNVVVRRLRWQSLPGLWAEGLWVAPKGPASQRWILIPDVGSNAESLVNEALLSSGAEVLIVQLLDRGHEHSVNPRFGVRTDVGHREWIYRQTYLQGRHVMGLELQAVLSWVDECHRRGASRIWLGGECEGGRLALLAAALDERISGVHCSGGFGPQQEIWAQPLDRNLFGVLLGHGDWQIAALLAPRVLSLGADTGAGWSPPQVVDGGIRRIAAPGGVMPVQERLREEELDRALKLAPSLKVMRPRVSGLAAAMAAMSDGAMRLPEIDGKGKLALPNDEGRMQRLVRGMERWAQEQLAIGERRRQAEFWQPLPLQSAPQFAQFVEKQRQRLWQEVIGRLPDPDRGPAPRTRLLETRRGIEVHEVVLDVYDGVFAWGLLCLPADLHAGQKRPVVVCQHGLEGLPEDVLNEDAGSRAHAAYKAFALRLAEQGFITFSPHNPYRGMHDFRTLQRKLNPVGLTLYSVINAQHQQILRWLKSLPMVRADRIGFYGLSYGGKSAMRTPACLPDYCLSICSGDFNEWVRKCVSLDMPSSYVHTHEYEIWEWNLGQSFNYAEMAALIAPRPFMVERGHDDGVGRDEWVNYEYAKVRQLYDKLGLGSLTEIEHFDGPHTIHGRGTFEFLRLHLRAP